MIASINVTGYHAGEVIVIKQLRNGGVVLNADVPDAGKYICIGGFPCCGVSEVYNGDAFADTGKPNGVHGG